MPLPHHPIHHLPPEIISKIFICCLPYESHPTISTAPLNVSSVCHAWRQIATSTPQLWSEIYITPLTRQWIFKRIKIWISRCSGYGFSFHIHCGYYDEGNLAEWNPLLDLLMEKCEMWRNIHVKEIPLQLIQRLVSFIPVRTPMIRKISIDAQNQFSITRLFAVPLIYLTHLTIVAPARSSPCINGLLLENLCSLNLEGVETSDLVECLSRSPRLQEVRALIRVDKYFRHESGHFKDRIFLAHLHFIHLLLFVRPRDQEGYFNGLFNHIDLPALQTLRLQINAHFISDRPMKSLWAPCISFACRYGAILQNLEIEAHFSPLPVDPMFLGRFVKLKHLAIPGNLLNKAFNRVLAPRFFSLSNGMSQSPLVLESLRVFSYYDRRFVDSAGLQSLVDLEAKLRPHYAIPLITIVKEDYLTLFYPCSVFLVMDGEEWETMRGLDLYKRIGW